MKAVQQAVEDDPTLRTVQFDGCFGWLHTPSSGLSNGIVVVLCPGLSTDGLTGYRPLRLLAAALANAGFPTLRFDYPSTGNSIDSDADDLWQLWQNSICTAIDWLQQYGLGDRVVLCGLRAGGTLAMEVSVVRPDVIGLLLLEPIFRGRSYLRQLGLEAGGSAAAPASSGPLAMREFTLSVKTVQRMRQIDLRLFRPLSSCRIGVSTQVPTKLLGECVAAWRGAGAIVSSLNFSGLEAMLRPVLMSHTASIDATSALAWLNSLPPGMSSMFSMETLPVESPLPGKVYNEIGARFGVRKAMFGILCEPARRAAAGIAVVVTNSSGNPAIGFGRFGVELARGIATAGIASLRMDFTGLGDSIAPNDSPTHILEVDRREELRAAVDLLIAHGYRRIAIQGLCSGAYHALQGAFADPRVDALLLVNLQHLVWDRRDRVELKGYELRHPTYFLRKLGTGAVWLNLVRGKFDVPGILGMLFARLSRELRRLGSGFGKRLRHQPQNPTTITERMRVLSLRAKTLFLMSEGDEGIAVLADAFGPALEMPGATVEILPGFDHALSSGAMRRVVIERSIAFLENNMGAEPAAQEALLEGSVV